MSPLTKVWNVFRRDRLDDELRAELESHVALLEADERARGMSAAQAQASARSRFGNPLLYREQSVDSLIVQWLDDFWRDLRYGLRQLAANPVLTAVLVLTLGLGIGATVAIFSVVDAVLLRPLPYAQSDRIVIVWETLRNLANGGAAAGVFADWKEQNSVFQDMAAGLATTYNLADAGEPERLNGMRVTPAYFRVAEMPPAAGRYFTEQDLTSNERLAVLGELLWRQRFGGDRSLIGREIRLSGEAYTVVGIAPAAFALTDARRTVVGGFSGQLWTPLVFTPEQRASYGSHTYRVLAKLKPAVSREQAQAEMERVTREIAARQPLNMDARSVNVQSLRDALVGNVRTQTILLLAAVSLVLLIGCVNVSSLLLARASSRSKEMAIRSALGVGRARIVRQLLSESLVLAFAGGAVAIGVSQLGIQFLVRLGPPEVPRLREAGLHPTVLLFALGVTVFTGLLFGLAPALRVARSDLEGTLREGGKGSRTSATGDRVRGLLVVGEVALSLVLIVGAGLFVRSVWRLQRVPLGFATANVWMARLSLPAARYETPAAVTDAYRRILEELRSSPGVKQASASTDLPMNSAGIDVGVTVEGRTIPVGAMPIANIRLVTDDYLETITIPRQRGRLLQASDMRPGMPKVIVINQKMAETIWPGEDPLGKHISGWAALGAPEWREVVGVVSDTRSFGQFAPVQPEMFLPYTQAPEPSWGPFQRSMALVIKTSGGAADAAAMLRRAVRAVDPSLPLYAIQPLDQVVATSTDGPRFNMLLLTLLAATGLVLAVVGIYAVIVYFVMQRTSEIGLRLALGATNGAVVGMVMRQAALLALAGIGSGVVGAVAATRMLTSLLFEISPTDPVTYALGVTFLFALALFASALPARRATRIDPVKSLAGG
jgi:predicted permease